jgi:asparagine synthase (glutamine-hydrolysing)
MVIRLIYNVVLILKHALRLWDVCTGKEDPSGRAVAGVHDSAYANGGAAAAEAEPAPKKAKV